MEGNYNSEILRKFSKDLINTDRFNNTMVNNIVIAAVHSECPYKLLEQLLMAYTELLDDYTKLVLEGPAPQIIIVTDLVFEEIKKDLKP